MDTTAFKVTGMPIQTLPRCSFLWWCYVTALVHLMCLYNAVAVYDWPLRCVRTVAKLPHLTGGGIKDYQGEITRRVVEVIAEL